MCIKLAYITIYFGLHLQYMIHICMRFSSSYCPLSCERALRACERVDLPSLSFLLRKILSIFTCQNFLAAFVCTDYGCTFRFLFFVFFSLYKRLTSPPQSQRFFLFFYFFIWCQVKSSFEISIFSFSCTFQKKKSPI